MTEQSEDDGIAIDTGCGCVGCLARSILILAEALSERRPDGFDLPEMSQALLMAAAGSAVAMEKGRAQFTSDAIAAFDGATLTIHEATSRAH